MRAPIKGTLINSATNDAIMSSARVNTRSVEDMADFKFVAQAQPCYAAHFLGPVTRFIIQS